MDPPKYYIRDDKNISIKNNLVEEMFQHLTPAPNTIKPPVDSGMVRLHNIFCLGVYPQIFWRSRQLLLTVSDLSTPSMRKVDDKVESRHPEIVIAVFDII